MEKCTPKQYKEYLQTFTAPDAKLRSLINKGAVGLIELPMDKFKYDTDLGYAFEVAVLAEEKTNRKLLFIRIDSWDRELREKAAPGEIDYCIPGAYEGASPKEKLRWSIPFDCGWSDGQEEALLVFDSTWAVWLKRLTNGIAFTNAGAESGAFLKFENKHLEAIRAFCEKSIGG